MKKVFIIDPEFLEGKKLCLGKRSIPVIYLCFPGESERAGKIRTIKENRNAYNNLAEKVALQEIRFSHKEFLERKNEMRLRIWENALKKYRNMRDIREKRKFHGLHPIPFAHNRILSSIKKGEIKGVAALGMLKAVALLEILWQKRNSFPYFSITKSKKNKKNNVIGSRRK